MNRLLFGYNLNWLRDRDDIALDTAVVAAYGFNAKKDLLAQLLALNQEVAAKIEKGEPVTAPGVHPKTIPMRRNW